MITIKNVKTLDGKTTDLQVPASLNHQIDAEGRLLLIPGLIDPHISLGSPESENWKLSVESVVRGGFSTVLDIPSSSSPSSNKEELINKKRCVSHLLAELDIPLHYYPYPKAHSKYIEDLGILKNSILGSLVLFQRDENDLEDDAWDRVFQIAAWEDLPVIINSHNENGWKNTKFSERHAGLLEKAMYYAEKQNARLFVLNVATKDELNLIREAREKSLLIYAETTLQHLFKDDPSQSDFLWEAINNGTIESLGSGCHFEEIQQEKLTWRGQSFDFLNPIFFLPLLLTAYHEKKINLENIVRSTRVNLYDIFKLERGGNDFVLVDLEKEETLLKVGENRTSEIVLKGWPEYTVLQDRVFKLSPESYHLMPIE